MIDSANAQRGQTAELVSQTEQMQQQVWAQERELFANERERRREGRTQYIAARLNASVALLQAYKDDLSRRHVSGGFSADLSAEEREIKRLHQDIAILRCAAENAHIDLPWPKAEKLAVRTYLIDIFEDLARRLTSTNEPNARLVPSAWHKTELIEGDLRLLADKYRNRFPMIAEAAAAMVANAPHNRSQVGGQDQLAAILDWIQGHLQSTLQETNPRWPQDRVRHKKARDSAAAGDIPPSSSLESGSL